MKVSVFLPCKKKSIRVKNKNKKKIYSYNFGLVEIKLKQLLKVKLINKIFLSTDDKKIISYAKNIKSRKIIIDFRKKNLCQPNTSTDDLVNYVPHLIKNSHILWTHVTSPFVNEKIYTRAIKKYFNLIKKKKYDSLCTTTIFQKFLWDKNKPFNYDNKVTKWPNTQTIKKLYEINSGIFLAHSNIYLKYNDRIGKNPFFFNLDQLHSLDVDTKSDFILVEKIIKSEKKII